MVTYWIMTCDFHSCSAQRRDLGVAAGRAWGVLEVRIRSWNGTLDSSSQGVRIESPALTNRKPHQRIRRMKLHIRQDQVEVIPNATRIVVRGNSNLHQTPSSEPRIQRRIRRDADPVVVTD
jgi:hypothetical protein